MKKEQLEEKMSKELKEEETRRRKVMEIELKKDMDSKREENGMEEEVKRKRNDMEKQISKEIDDNGKQMEDKLRNRIKSLREVLKEELKESQDKGQTSKERLRSSIEKEVEELTKRREEEENMANLHRAAREGDAPRKEKAFGDEEEQSQPSTPPQPRDQHLTHLELVLPALTFQSR